MQESRFTRMAGWLESACQRAAAVKRLCVTATKSACRQKCEVGSCDAARCGWSATSNSITMARAFAARSVAVLTFMPTPGARMHEAASTRSPSISTMHARQFPSGRYPGSGLWHRCGMWVPRRCATAQMVSPGRASTGCPSSSKMIPGLAWTLMTNLLCRDPPGRWEQLREEANDAREGIGGSLTQTANGRIPHALGQLAQELRIPHFLLHQHARLLRADAARCALAAGLVLEETHEIERRAAHIILVRHHDDGRRPDEAAVLFEGSKIQRNVIHGRRQ